MKNEYKISQYSKTGEWRDATFFLKLSSSMTWASNVDMMLTSTLYNTHAVATRNN